MPDTPGAGVSGFKKSPFRLPATNHAGLGMRGAARRFYVIFHRALSSLWKLFHRPFSCMENLQFAHTLGNQCSVQHNSPVLWQTSLS
jgi:hypothetical protein